MLEMNSLSGSAQIREDDELDALLSLQSIEGQEDDPLLQMFSSSSCFAGSCS
jgi:hypothetical protein